MTATVPDTTVLDDLDFDAPVLCDVNECGKDKIAAQHATALLVLDLPCCVTSAPVCRVHAGEARLAVLVHLTTVCAVHGTHGCAHRSLRIEPLP